MNVNKVLFLSQRVQLLDQRANGLLGMYIAVAAHAYAASNKIEVHF